MAELVIGGVAAPSATKYDLTYNEINGAEEMFENGSAFIERIKNKVPSISASWTNLSGDDAKTIIDAVTENPIFDVQYLEFGGMQSSNMRCKRQKVTLKYYNGSSNVYDVSITLEGC